MPPAGGLGTLRPTQAGFGDIVQGGGQACFLVMDFSVFAPGGAGGRGRGVDDQDHRAIGFGDDALGPNGGEGAHGRRWAGGQDVAVVQGDCAHAAHRDVHPVMFLYFLRRGREGVVGPEIGEGALQAPRAAPILHGGGLAKRPKRLRPAAPELFVQLMPVAGRKS